MRRENNIREDLEDVHWCGASKDVLHEHHPEDDLCENLEYDLCEQPGDVLCNHIYLYTYGQL